MNQRVLQKVAATVSGTFVDQNGAARAPGSPVTVTITRADGTAVVTAQTATADSSSTGRYTYALTAAQTTNLDLLTAVWTSADGSSVTTKIEVVGGYYFTIDEARSLDQSLADPGRYSDEAIVRARQEVETECELIVGRAFVPRFRRLFLDGSGVDRLQLPDMGITTIRALSNYGTALTSDQIADIIIDRYGEIWYEGSSFYAAPGAVVISYEYGETSPPADIRRAALIHLRYALNRDRSGIPDRATSFTAEGGGVFSLATPGRSGFDTGIPEVDAVYQRYKVSVPAVA